MDRRRLVTAAAVLVPALLLVAVAALAVIDDDEGGQVVSTDAATSSTVEETTTTAPTTTTTAAPTTVATAAPVATTAAAARPATTSTTAPARQFNLNPTSGPANSHTRASGTGCTGQDAGVAVEWFDPSGNGITGDGTSAQPDGTWTLDVAVPNAPPGRYVVKAKCQGSNPFQYNSRVFTIT